MGFRFVVDFPGMGVAGFSEISGIQAETEVQDYMEGGLNGYVHKFPTRTKHANLTLKRGVVDRALWDWYLKVISGKVELKTGTIRVQDTSGAVAIEWSVLDAFPSKWVGPD